MNNASVSISWGELAGVCAVLSFFGALATGYLRVAMGKAIQDMANSLNEQMRANFVIKEFHRPEMHEVKKSVTKVEAHMERLEDRIGELELENAKKK